MNNTTNLKISNYSTHLKTQQIIDCLNLLPDKYNQLNNKVYIFRSYNQYLFYCLKHFKFISLFAGIILLLKSKITKKPLFGDYRLSTKQISLYEDSYRKLLENIFKQIDSFNDYDSYKDYITEDIIEDNLHCYISYMLLDSLIHELTHALQHKEKTLIDPFLLIFKKYEEKQPEIDAVKTSIEIFNKHHDDFIKILDVEGIKINHSLDPLKIDYKLEFCIPVYYD